MTNQRKKALRFEAAASIMWLHEKLEECISKELSASKEEIEYTLSSLDKLLGAAHNRARKQFEKTGGIVHHPPEVSVCNKSPIGQCVGSAKYNDDETEYLYMECIYCHGKFDTSSCWDKQIEMAKGNE